MKKLVFWIIGIIVLIGLAAALIFFLNNSGIIDLNTVVSTLSTEAPSSSSLSEGGMV